MADLMTDTYDYSALANKYGNFQVPAFKIKVDGTEVFEKNGPSVKSIDITLSLKYAGSAVIQITGAYDEKTRSFQSRIKKALALGKVAEVELGYLSSFIQVFKGYVASVSLTVSEKPEMRVTLMDVRKLMMEAKHKERYFDNENYSDIVSKVMDDYTVLCSLEQESTSDGLTKKIYQSTSDYDFIANVLGKKLKKEFLLCGDKAYFRTPGKNTAEMLTLEYGISLLSFEKTANYLDLNVITTSYDKKEQTRIQSELTAKGKDVSDTVLGKPPTEVVIAYDAQTVEELTKLLEEIVRQKVEGARTGKGSCIGIPELVPGRYVKISKADGADMDGKYYITEVRHSIGEQGFLTQFFF